MGFPQLADLIARDRDHETYVFRSFSQIATRTLLQLQNELAILEKEQHRLDDDAAKLTSSRQVQIMLTRWRDFDALDKEARCDPEVKQRIELANKIAEKLERYCGCVGKSDCLHIADPSLQTGSFPSKNRSPATTNQVTEY